MTAIFISDLHLDDRRPEATDAFAHFLDTLPEGTTHLYILGDLFESWVGDDDYAPLPNRVADLLSTVRDRGVRIGFMHGNRDFALGEAYAQRAGMMLLDDPTRVDLPGGDALLMHGDTLCTDDLDYQAFRAQVRDPAWLAQMLSQPLAVRRAFAAQARAGSQAHTAATAESIMDVNAGAVERAFREHGTTLLIHGHTHRPAVHRIELDGQHRTRIVLGDWYEQGTVLHVHRDGRMVLSRLERDTD